MLKPFFIALIFMFSIFTYAQKFDHSSWTVFLQTYVSDKGKVNYKAIQKHPEQLENYLNQLADKTPQNKWSKDEKLAYWINAYNAFTIKLIIDHYPVKSIKDIKNAWKMEFVSLGDKLYSLDHIEHSIIRKMNEPRIHFALVCAAKSCPRLYNKAFEGSSLDSVLTMLTEEFLADSSKNILSENHLELSKIFQWFAKDFKKNGSLIDFLNRYSKATIAGNARTNFKAYNWDLNE